jgi:MFS family permease
MTRAFYIILAAQFFSSLADNALLAASVVLLIEMHADPSQQPLLKAFFTISYVVLAPFVGAFADSRPKGNVMFITNLIKVFGAAIMLFGLHPMLAYAVVGLGAAAYSPAKYGIITELLPPEKLVAANGWIEAATILSIIFGTVLGASLATPTIQSLLTHALPASFSLSPATSAILSICSAPQSPNRRHRHPIQRTSPHAHQAHARLLALQYDVMARQIGANFFGHHHHFMGHGRRHAIYCA